MGGSCSCNAPNDEKAFEIDRNSLFSENQSRVQIQRLSNKRISSIEDYQNRNSKFLIIYEGNTEDFEMLQQQLNEMKLNGRITMTKCYEDDTHKNSQTYKDQPHSFYQLSSSSEAIDF